MAAASLSECAQPLEDWMPIAMAELVQALQAFGGIRQTTTQILKRWGFAVSDPEQDMSDDQWLTFGRSHSAQHAGQV